MTIRKQDQCRRSDCLTFAGAFHDLAGKRRHVAEPWQQVDVIALGLRGDGVQFLHVDVGPDTHSEHRRLRIQTFGAYYSLRCSAAA